MDNFQKQLYERILSFQIDLEDSTLSFSDRLGRENMWSREYTDKCIEEYKKFLYLAAVSDRHVTPSDQIDQVWHLHLLYTQSYWSDLCPNVLGSVLHHNPAKGGYVEAAKFYDQYQYTLERYAEEFGEPPPEDIWPKAKTRFLNADNFVRVNSSLYCIRPRLLVLPILIVAFVIGLAKENAGMLILAGVLLFFEYTLPRKKTRRNEPPGGCGGGCGGCGG